MVGRVRRVLALRAFRRLWIVTFLCSTADWLALLGVADLVANTTDNYTVKNFAFSGVVLSNIVPGLLFAPIGGLLADRFDRRTIMVFGDVLRCVLLLSVVVTDLPWWPFVASFLVSSVAMTWIPAKDAAVPNLLRGPDQIETANQLGMVMTYGLAVIAGGGLYALTGIGPSLGLPEDVLGANGTIKLAIAVAAVLYLASAVSVARRIPELSLRGTPDQGNRAGAPAEQGGPAGIGAMVRDVGRFVRTTPVVRGLVIGAVGAFAAGGAVIGSAQTYAISLLAGQAGFGLLFAAVFVGLTLGMIGAPRFAARLAHERLFGVAIVLAGVAMVFAALSPHLFVSLAAVVLVGACAGAAFLTGVTIIGTRVEDDLRGRVNAIYQSLMKVVLGSALAVVPVLVGLTRPRTVELFGNKVIIDGTRPVLLGAAVLACVAGVLAYRQMDDRRPEPILADLRNAVRRHPQRTNGIMIAVEGTHSVDVAAHTADLADWLRGSGVRKVVVAADLSPDDPRLAAVVSGAALSSARARVLAAAAVRADIFEREIRPVLDDGGVAVIEHMVDSPLEALSTVAELDEHDVALLADWATGRLRPDVTVLLDRGGETTQAMLSSGQNHWRMRQLLREMTVSNPSRCLVVEVGDDPEDTRARIRHAVATALPSMFPGRD
jgi:dTMP kinase